MQRLTPKSQTINVKKIVAIVNFTGTMSGRCLLEIGEFDPASIISYTNPPPIGK
jgi:hypothetical protein